MSDTDENGSADDLVFSDDDDDAATSLEAADLETAESLDPLEGSIEDYDEVAPTAADRREESPENVLKRSIFSVPIEVTVTVGTARPLIGELVNMGRDHLLPLDSSIDDPVELRVKDRVIARGELTQTEDDGGKLGIRLTEIVELSDLQG